MGRKSCQSRASMARSPLTHTVNYACSEHKHRFYSKTVLYIHTQTWNTRSFSHLTALLLRWTLLYLTNTSSAASLKTNMLIRRMNNVKSETLNNKKKADFSQAVPRHTVSLNKCLFLHGSVSVDFKPEESENTHKAAQLFNHGALQMGMGLQSQLAKCSRQLLCGRWSASLIL